MVCVREEKGKSSTKYKLKVEFNWRILFVVTLPVSVCAKCMHQDLTIHPLAHTRLL